MDEKRPGMGILITCVAFSGLSIADAILKWVSARSPVNETFFITASVAALFLFGYANLKSGFASLKTTHLKLHMMRGIVFLIQFSIGIYALRHVPLTSFYALIFIAPMFITILSAIFLKEKADWQQWLATVCGFWVC